MGDGRHNAEKEPPTDKVVIPSLHLEKPADENDASAYPKSLNLVDLYMQSRDSVVEVNSWNGDEKDPLIKFAGTGFFVKPDGKLATNFHVINGREHLEVITYDGKKFKATVEAVDVPNDLAVLKVQPDGQSQSFKPLPLGDSRGLKALQNMVVLGHPHGWDPLFSSAGMHEKKGLLIDTGLGRGTPELDDPFRKNLVTNIHIEPGNSGSPMMDESGKVVGIISLQEGPGRAHSIPVEYLDKLLKGDNDPIAAAYSRFSADTRFLVSTGLQAANIGGLLGLALKPRPSKLAGMFSIGLGAHDLITEDLGNLKASIEARSIKGFILSGLGVTADACLIAGGAMTMSKRFIVPGLLVSTLGSALKVGPDVAHRLSK